MKLKDIKKVEFWLATLLCLVATLILVSDTNKKSDGGIHIDFIIAKITYSYFFNFFLPRLAVIVTIYASFLALNFYLLPAIIQRRREMLAVSLIVMLSIAAGLIFGISRTHSHTYELLDYKNIQQGYNRMFFEAFSKAILLMVVLSAYTCIKQLLIYLIRNMAGENALQKQMKMDLAFGIAFWCVGLLLWVASRSHHKLAVLWTLVVLSGVGIVIYAVYYLLPELHKQQKKINSFFWTIFIISGLLALPLSVLAMFFFQRNIQSIFILLAFHLPTQMLISAPLSWFLYKRRAESRAEIRSLRSELGKSDANLHFLKSQINPHFLFNALNTLYGTALQEQAERTGEGIQKLGDMMRFMLHENLQDSISLMREVDYLNNYIDLQTLRTSRSADIKIETAIATEFADLQIAPMLLIPFVENAFKHGISLLKPSYIKITLQVQDNLLYFDVSNSINPKNDNDPEKLKSGVGLANVRQRMSLLYKDRHDLVIRENVNEFFVHLTLTL